MNVYGPLGASGCPVRTLHPQMFAGAASKAGAAVYLGGRTSSAYAVKTPWTHMLTACERPADGASAVDSRADEASGLTPPPAARLLGGKRDF